MAECSLATFRGQYQGRWTQSNSRFSPRNMPVGMSMRNHAHTIHLPCHSSATREWRNCAFTSGFHGRGHRVETLVKCSFLEPLMGSESMASPNLMLILDEALLSISIVFVYLAGIVPSGQTFPPAKNKRANQHPTEPSSRDSENFRDGRYLPEGNIEFNPSYTWSEVRAKLLEALQANVNSREDELTSDRKNYPLSMLAIHRGPRLRLLLIMFQLLEIEVESVPESSEIADGARWLQVSTTLIDGLIQPAFMKWIEEEALENAEINEKLMNMIISKIKEEGEDRILKRFDRIGKSDLYLDLLFFLRFGSARWPLIGGCTNTSSQLFQCMETDLSYTFCPEKNVKNQQIIKQRRQTGGSLHSGSLMYLFL